MRIKPKNAPGSHHPAGMSSEEKDLKRLEKLCQLMARNHVAELEWERKGEKLRLRTGAPVAVASAHPAALAAAPAPAHPSVSSPAPQLSAAPAPQAGLPSNQKQVTSPFVGTFYRAPAPTAEPYVRESQLVKKGDVLCIIEAMKLMNEIEAEFPGKIISVLVENGQPVEFGEPLFVMET